MEQSLRLSAEADSHEPAGIVVFNADDAASQIVTLLTEWFIVVMALVLAGMCLAYLVRIHPFHGWKARLAVVCGTAAAFLLIRLVVIGPSTDWRSLLESLDWITVTTIALVFLGILTMAYWLLGYVSNGAPHHERDHGQSSSGHSARAR